MGTILVVISGFSILTNKHVRTAATLLGVAIAAVVLFIYLPMPVVAAQPLEVNNAVNYIADTTLFAGSIFLPAATIPVGFRSASAIREPGPATNAGGKNDGGGPRQHRSGGREPAIPRVR